MDNNLDDIQEILSHFFSMKAPLYAVLICGEWGSGKTYWWKNDFVPTLEKNREKFLYVSLNGLSSPKDASKKLLCEIIKSKVGISPHNATVNNTLIGLSKAVLHVVESVKKIMVPFLGAMESIAKIDVDASDILNLYESLDKYIICIDDLERYNCGNVESILGWISDLIELQKTHIVILANEGKIKNFSLLKEKVVGRTIGLRLDSRQVISSIIQDVYDGNSDVKSFLEKHINLIVSMFEDSKKNNYRVLRTMLDDFCFLYIKAQKQYADILEISGEDILRACLAFGMELRANELKEKNKEDFRNALYSKVDRGLFRDYSSKNVALGDRTRFEEFCKKYSPHLASFWFRFSCVFDYMDRGYLDLHLFCDMLSHYRKKEPAPLEYMLHYSPFELEDGKFHEVSDGVLKMVQTGDIALRYYQVLFAHYALYVCRGLIDKSVEELKGIFIEGLEQIGKKTDADADVSNPQNHFVKDYLPMDCEDVYETIKMKVQMTSAEMKKKEEKETKCKFMEWMNEKPEDAIRMLQIGEIPAGVFDVSDAEVLFGDVKKLPNKDKLAFETALKYYYVNAATINADRQFLDKFQQCFKCYLKDNNEKKSPSIALMKQISSFIEACLDQSGTINEMKCH